MTEESKNKKVPAISSHLVGWSMSNPRSRTPCHIQPSLPNPATPSFLWKCPSLIHILTPNSVSVSPSGEASLEVVLEHRQKFWLLSGSKEIIAGGRWITDGPWHKAAMTQAYVLIPWWLHYKPYLDTSRRAFKELMTMVPLLFTSHPCKTGGPGSV